MSLKQQIIRTMFKGLPPEEQVFMVTDYLNWVFSDCTPNEFQERLDFWTPRLIRDISVGKFGLWLIILHYGKYLVSRRWLRYWFNPIKASQEDHLVQ